MIKFTLEHPDMTHAALGYLPDFFDEADPRPAREQIHERYRHGGGWRPFKGFTMADDGSDISFPGDPPMVLLAEAKLRDETLRFYDCAWLAIVQPDGSFEVSRVD